MTPRDGTAGHVRSVAIYGGLVALALGGFEVVKWLGHGLRAPPATSVAVAPIAANAIDVMPHVLLALATILAAARALGWVFARLGQPRVIGEIVAGLLLGPSALGAVAPATAAFLMPAEVAPYLGVLAQIGVVLFLFLVGLEMDPATLRARGRSTVAISHASIVAPFLLGAALALVLYPRVGTDDIPFGVFALFLGVSMSVTAFPVLARILTDRGMQTTPLGVLALTCAAVDDVTAWCLLAYVVSVAGGQAAGVAVTVALTVAFVAAMFLVVRPLLRRWIAARGDPELTLATAALAFVGVLLSALATEAIGIHALFGAFAFGAVVPSRCRIAIQLRERIGGVVTILFLPVFFAFTGTRTRIGLVEGAEGWLLCGAIIVVATVGKFGGTLLAARLTGIGWRDAASLGVLMNTRGLVELVVLNVGLDLGVISPALFTMLVVMALVTTFATTPVLKLLQRA